MPEGGVHITTLAPESFSVSFVAYQSGSDSVHPHPVAGLASLTDYLTKAIGVDSKVVHRALDELKQKRSTTISHITLSDSELFKLGLNLKDLNSLRS